MKINALSKSGKKISEKIGVSSWKSSVNLRNIHLSLANCYIYLIRHRWRVLTITVVGKSVVVDASVSRLYLVADDIAITISRVVKKS